MQKEEAPGAQLPCEGFHDLHHAYKHTGGGQAGRTLNGPFILPFAFSGVELSGLLLGLLLLLSEKGAGPGSLLFAQASPCERDG